MEVDPGYEFGFRGVGWAWNKRRVIIVGVVVVRDWVRLVDVRRWHIFYGRSA